MTTSPEMLWRTVPDLDERLTGEFVSLVRDANVAPGASAAVAVRIDGVFHSFLVNGGSRRWAALAPIFGDEWYDLASVTKSAFAVTLARLAQSGDLDLTAPLQTYFHHAQGTAAGDSSIESLLSHRAGLQAHVEFFAPLRDGLAFDRQSALELAMRAVREGGQTDDPVYSDLGYLLLGEAVRLHFGYEHLGNLVTRELQKLGVDEIAPAAQLTAAQVAKVVPTETLAWRGGEICAAVHDDNAFAFAGPDMCGHAGLFGTASGVLKFACALLDIWADRHPGMPRAALEPLLRRRSGGTLRAGFDGKSTQNSAIGTVLSDETFGHLGFTGTSFWCDPTQQIAVVLLCNRVCPTRDNINIRAARPKLHDLLAEHALEIRTNALG